MASRRAAMETGPCSASFMLFARGGRRGAEGAAQVGLVRSNVGHGVPPTRKGTQSNFRVPESRIVPTATRFDDSIPPLGPGGRCDPRFRLGLATPRRAVDARGGFFSFDATPTQRRL